MSHINDLIGVLRGLRMVTEAGLKVQQEASQVIWNNSSFKALLQALPTNPPTLSTPTPDLAKDIVQRALVVAQGFRQYAVMHVPNFNPDVETKAEMDPQTKDEIDNLNREFNKTFESLEKSQHVKPSDNVIISPIENVVKEVTRRKIQTPMAETLKSKKEMQPSQAKVPGSAKKMQPSQAELASAKVNTQVEPNIAAASGAIAKPSAKKKLKVAVSNFKPIFSIYFYSNLVANPVLYVLIISCRISRFCLRSETKRPGRPYSSKCHLNNTFQKECLKSVSLEQPNTIFIIIYLS